MKRYNLKFTTEGSKSNKNAKSKQRESRTTKRNGWEYIELLETKGESERMAKNSSLSSVGTGGFDAGYSNSNIGDNNMSRTSSQLTPNKEESLYLLGDKTKMTRKGPSHTKNVEGLGGEEQDVEQGLSAGRSKMDYKELHMSLNFNDESDAESIGTSKRSKSFKSKDRDRDRDRSREENNKPTVEEYRYIKINSRMADRRGKPACVCITHHDDTRVDR